MPIGERGEQIRPRKHYGSTIDRDSGLKRRPLVREGVITDRVAKGMERFRDAAASKGWADKPSKPS